MRRVVLFVLVVILVALVLGVVFSHPAEAAGRTIIVATSARGCVYVHGGTIIDFFIDNFGRLRWLCSVPVR